jgi:hypothetical protein
MNEKGSYLLTRAIARDALRIPGIAEDLPSWRAAHATRDEAEVDVACKLQKMFSHHYQCCALNSEVRKFVRLALMHVNFRRVAKFLLDRFTREPDYQQLVAARRFSSLN